MNATFLKRDLMYIYTGGCGTIYVKYLGKDNNKYKFSYYCEISDTEKFLYLGFGGVDEWIKSHNEYCSERYEFKQELKKLDTIYAYNYFTGKNYKTGYFHVVKSGLSHIDLLDDCLYNSNLCLRYNEKECVFEAVLRFKNKKAYNEYIDKVNVVKQPESNTKKEVFNHPYYIDYICSDLNNCYYQLVRAKDNSILYANANLDYIYSFCFKSGIIKRDVILL